MKNNIRSGMQDLISGTGLLTRIPVPVLPEYRAKAAWTWPLVGLIPGVAAALSGWLCLRSGTPVGIAAAFAMATTILITGGLHEDGLADSADGLFGGRNKKQRLKIMKDSSIGSYGTLALLLVTLANWSALNALFEAGHLNVLVGAAVLSRFAMVAMICVLPSARGTGAAHSVGRPPLSAAVVAFCCAFTICLTMTSSLLAMLSATAITTIAVAFLAKRHLGGQTGDILGASQKMSELAVLTVAASSL